MFGLIQLSALLGSSTTTDFVLISHPDKVTQSGFIWSGFNDHHIVNYTRKSNIACYNKHKLLKSDVWIHKMYMILNKSYDPRIGML